MRFIDPRHDRWHRVDGEDGPLPAPRPAAPTACSTLEQWHAVRDTWPRGLPVGVMLPNTLDVETLAADLPPRACRWWRCSSRSGPTAAPTARRACCASRYRFDGEVRATGEVLVDMLPLLQRTGFDAVALRADQTRRGRGARAGLLPRPLPGRRAASRAAVRRATWRPKPPRAARRAELFAGQGI